MMFDRIINFMQRQDPNGNWLDASEDEVEYIFETLQAWLNDGLKSTPATVAYMGFLTHLTHLLHDGKRFIHKDYANSIETYLNDAHISHCYAMVSGGFVRFELIIKEDI